MSNEVDLLLAVVVDMQDGAVADGQGYEDAVLRLLARHGGRLERRLRSIDGVTEVQIIRFVSPAATPLQRRSLNRDHPVLPSSPRQTLPGQENHRQTAKSSPG